MKIQAIKSFSPQSNKKKKNISFFGRVDKGLERFYDVNKTNMPIDVWRYTDALADKTKLSPMEVHARAYNDLGRAKSIEDIQAFYPDEKMFSELRNPTDTKSATGILKLARQLDKDMKDLGIGALKTKENLTVYLVKKLFMESKTLPEINKDLEKDLDDLFKSEYKSRNGDSEYISNTILKTLGIKRPSQSYINSLKFTRPGYSDEFAATLSIVQKLVWDSLSDNERDARARKSLEKFENWWNSKTQDEKLEMIANQDSELEMKKDYDKYKGSLLKVNHIEKNAQNVEKTSEKRIKIGSEKLRQDSLFTRWATNNLKIFEANLTEKDRLALQTKRAQKMASYWEKMSPAERTEYITKLKTGSEPMHYVMIDAWNNSFSLLTKLSDFLSKKNIEKSEEKLYSKENMNLQMSEMMTEFWNTHYEEAIEFGKAISKAWTRINTAISNNKFEQLKTELAQKRKQRIEDFKAYKRIYNTEPQISEYSDENLKKVLKEYFFEDEYKNIKHEVQKHLLDDTVNMFINGMDDKQKHSAYEDANASLVFGDFNEAVKQHIRKTKTRLFASMESALNIVLRKNLDIKENSSKFFSLDEAFDILSQIEAKRKNISIYNKETGITEEYSVKSRYINKQQIYNLYDELKDDIDEDDIKVITESFYNHVSEADKKEIADQLRLYGKNIINIFSPNCYLPPATQKAMHDKLFITNSKYSLMALENEYWQDQTNRQDFSKTFREVCPFLPKEFTEMYLRSCCDTLNPDSIDKLLTAVQYFQDSDNENNINSKFTAIPEIDKTNFSLNDKTNFLAIEAALADIVYKHCNRNEVYGYHFEDLLTPLLIKYNIKNENDYIYSTDMFFSFRNKKINYNLLTIKYKQYLNEINKWLKDRNENKAEALKELLYILNPYEENAIRDSYILKKLNEYEIEKDL